jgi:hypothetical protein
MKVKINSLPDGYSIVNGKVYRDGGSTTGNQDSYGLVQFPLLDDTSTVASPFDSVNYSLSPVPRDEANLEAEKGETVLTDMNNDGDFELYEISGKRHHKGGTPLNLPPQSFIYSDTPKMKLNKYELAEMNLTFPTKVTPAKVSKMYQLNNFISLLDNEHSDKITKDTANYMLDKNKRSLSQLAFLQEAKKEFEDGVPLAAYPYLTEKGIDPIDFSQKVEDITRKEAEQKMLMQLPIEERMQLLIAKEQMQEQQKRQVQQNELIKQGQLPPSMMNQKAPNPNQDMGIQEQMSGQGMAPQGMMPPQGMPPQAMMPPQSPMGGQQQSMMPPPQQMQQPMQQPAMARRGGQISLLNRKRGGYVPRYNRGGYVNPYVYNPYIIMARNGSELPQFGWGSSLMDWGQGALSVAGMIPGVGIIADAANTAISGGRAAYAGYTGDTAGRNKHLANAALNATAMIPGVGQIATATKAGKGVLAATKAKTISKTAGLIGDDVASTALNVGNKYIDKVEDITKIGDNITDTVIGTGQGANLYKKGDFVADEVQGKGKFNQNRQYGDFENQTPGEQVAINEALETNQNASVTTDQAANEMVASVSTNDVMDAETESVKEASIQEQEVVADMEGQGDNDYVPQSQQEEEEYNPQSLSAWGYEIPKLQKGGYDAILDAEIKRQLNLNDDSNSSTSVESNDATFNTPDYNTFTQFIGPLNQGDLNSPAVQEDINVVLENYKNSLLQSTQDYNQLMLDNIEAYDNAVSSSIPSLEQQMMMLNVSGMQKPDDNMVEVWENHINAGGLPPDSPDVNYTQAYKNINGEDTMPTYKNAEKNKNNTIVKNITNVYSTPQEKMDDLSSAYINEEIMKGYQRNPYPTEGDDEQAQFAQYIPRGRQSQVNFDDPNSPYYAGASWTMQSGGSLPKAQLGGDPDSPGYYAPYTIKEGENATQIAYDWNLDLKTLLEMNPQIADPSKIYPGQEIEIGFPSFYRRPNTPPGDPAFWPDDWETNFQEDWYRPASGYDRSSTYPGNYKSGGDFLPLAQKGKETITYQGREYTRKELEKMDPKSSLYKAIMQKARGTDGQNIIDEINASRKDIEATEETTEYLTSGEQDWNEYYQGEGDDATQFRNDRYNNYLTVAEQNGLTPLSEEDFHKNYVKFQEQNRWMNENMTEDELNNPGWDRKNVYTPCGEGESGCIEIDGKKWKKGEEKGVNWQYNQAMENAGMDAFDQDMIKHMQAGFMGGKMMEMSEDERAQLEHSGVGDQQWQGFNISGTDGVWGNTTNRQLEGTKQVTPGTERQPCSNADEMQAACAEAGGNWTPFVAAVTAEDGTVTTPPSGCTCDKPIKVPEKKIEEKDTPFWLQDELAIGNALDDKLSLKKRYPWAPFYQKPQIDAVFKDPTREIAAIGEMAAQATDAATAFGGGSGRAMAAALAAQGNAMKGISDAVNQVQNDNVTVANTVNTKNAELEYKTQLLNNSEMKQLYDNTVLTDENYDNAMRKANAKLTGAMQNAYTNRANTANLNSIYPQFDIDPASGGMIDITDPKAFYADPNYQDPQSHLDNYTETIDKLRKANVPEEQWPVYKQPNQTKGKSFAQQNQEAITSGGYQQGRRGREMRILKKGMELRNWFSPLRGK